jgi:hypothetical protein
MKRVFVSIGLAVTLMLGSTPELAQAAHHYSSCTAMHKDWAHGVAKSRRAANREVADGYGRPHVSRRLYRANRDLDANDDGVACEA